MSLNKPHASFLEKIIFIMQVLEDDLGNEAA